ncbi:lysozyme inhibitor LprI family protein [Chryseobacterium sp. YIM B08800]|uniref:lysozyme inhibitor LprI family protein n=1 Tax=Chryseobacterium sp. YIM B08800 TaxID=2984136 RepID=UPI00223EF71B|nr:lysozyme inhibitor LprI family protein [Chryseobacterium sp. YIM B08800]
MKKIIVLIFVFFSVFIFSQETHFIDIEESKCLDKKEISNAQMLECSIKAGQSWDKELNKYYNLLASKLPKDAFEILKTSQKEWIIYRDKEFKFISKLYYEVKEGTMWYIIAENKKKEIVKSRTLELQMFLEDLEY